MRGHKLITAAICALFLFSPVPSYAADSWVISREKSMRLKEANRAVEAYQAAVSYQANDGNMVDREFVAGWIALRNLGRSDIALAHFKNMTTYIPKLKRSEEITAAKAKAGYWLGRTLEAQGRAADAKVMYRASMAYSTTYYGQLSASEADVSLDKSHMSRSKSSFPLKDIYWHDKRARKELVLAVMRTESRFDQTAESPKGAKGAMQVMDETARMVGRDAGVKIDLNMMRKNEAYNIAVGSRVLGDLMQQYGNTVLAVSAYNAGPLRVEQWLKRFGDPRGGRTDPVDWVENIPFKETREYAQKVIGSYITYLAISEGR